ncbi:MULTISPECIES: GerW family sporulation protein [Streptomyces]|uniref:GerW family sporulation protein n=1 Tax=Streptomyces TaxID=1883 RepID=UPI001E314C92|nr:MULTISPECIES: GerW family sporulation protein [Streptomyces]UFQ18677.1 GerW family sporulation protein [Streptomyces huasconensis]WCL88295.1 GerW family sporulation protein [Streptomyces sp. JCM 35825]
MTAADETAGATPPAHMTDDDTPGYRLERLVEETGKRAATTVVYGEAVTTGDVTVIPVAEVGYGFGFGGPARGGTEADEPSGAGGVKARPRGFIEIKGGTVTYKPLRNPWTVVAVPLAAFLAGAAVPRLVRLLAGRRRG